MKHNDQTIQDKITQLVKESFDLTVESIEFIPVGEESYVYKLIASSGVFFVKFCEKTTIVQNIDVVNSLLVELDYLDFVIPPVKSKQGYSVPLNEGKVYIYPFIEGNIVTISNSDWDPDFVNTMIKIMADIHSAKNVRVKLPVESFTNNYESRLSTLTSANFDEDVSNLLNKNLNLIQELIGKHNGLAKKYKNTQNRFVLTHGDITGLNVIKTEKGIKLVDWDGAMFAPPERDINFFSDNTHFSLQFYSKLTGLTDFKEELQDYYGQSWSLDCIIQNFESLRDGGASKSDKGEYVEEIEEYLGYYK